MGEEGVEDQEDMAPEAGPPGESSISSNPQESAPMKVARDHGGPTTKEREDLNATHIPFRSWCSVCVGAKGKKGKERSCKATISFDHNSFV